MAESLLTVASSYLATQILADMGSGGSYGTLELSSVVQWARYDVVDFSKVMRPFGIVSAFQSTSQPAGHGSDNSIARKMQIPIAVTLVCEGDMATATANAQTLAWRLEKFLAGLRLSGTSVTADDGSKLSRVVGSGDGSLFTTMIGLWDKPTSSTTIVYGVAMAAFTVTGTAV